MARKLMPYGFEHYRTCIAKVGKSKAVSRLVARMPSAELAAKVGGQTCTMDLDQVTVRRVVRNNAQTEKVS